MELSENKNYYFINFLIGLIISILALTLMGTILDDHNFSLYLLVFGPGLIAGLTNGFLYANQERYLGKLFISGLLVYLGMVISKIFLPFLGGIDIVFGIALIVIWYPINIIVAFAIGWLVIKLKRKLK